MKHKLIILLLIISAAAFAITEADLSQRIIIDGVTDDFTTDEFLLMDDDGNVLESPTDSFWGEYNDLHQIKFSWDEGFLYIGLDGCSWDNNIILFIDIYDDYGVENMLDMNTWTRAFKFYNLNPDFFLATWDTNDNPQFWMLQEHSETEADQFEVEDFATFNTGNLNGGMEVKIPWGALYYSEERSMQNYPSIKVLAVITTGGDNLSGPDVVPDNLGGMANDSGQLCVLDNFAEVLIDEDTDGNPDMNVSPQSRVTFFEDPPVEAIPLDIVKIEFPNGKIFPSSQIEKFNFYVTPNRISQFMVEIYDLNGKFMSNAELIDDSAGYVEFEWNGYDDKNHKVPFGIYILRVISDSGEVSKKSAITVIK